MSKPRGRSHTTLTETASQVIRCLRRVPGIKMIAPGKISTTKRRKAGGRHITVVTTTAGCELIVTGQGVQNVAIHTTNTAAVVSALTNAKALRGFTVSERSRVPGE